MYLPFQEPDHCAALRVKVLEKIREYLKSGSVLETIYGLASLDEMRPKKPMSAVILLPSGGERTLPDHTDRTSSWQEPNER
ncbi:hypothetical protein DEDE109153_18165 [Deinococcus deserti]|uniref:hypothetical protein n=1 Tax=Deinococcus deserti TaxID=310783 RepID=UPI0002DB6483|nr:hypothetical protein [Deinococcus deserti]